MVRIANSACFVVATAVGLTACGGGSSGDDNANPGSGGGNENLVTIDAESAPLIAESVASAVLGGQNLSAVGGFSIPTPGVGLASFGKDVPQTLAADFGPEIVECAGGGSLETSGTVAVPESVTVNDTLSFLFTDCNDGEGVVIDGGLSFEIVAISGDIATGMLTLTVSMTLEALQFVENGVGGSMNGELSFTIDTTNVPETFMSVSSSLFTITSGTGSETLIDYIMTMSVDPNVGSVTVTVSATLESSEFDGDIEFVTAESLVFTSTGGPSAGRIVVTGNDSTMTINFVSGEQIELDVDVDGNETTDHVIVTNWAELTG
jgi:hypothetical protein